MKKIIVRQTSGLGNQMFVYGCGYALAKEYNMPLVQDLSKYYLRMTSSYYQLNDYQITYKSLLNIPFKKPIRSKQEHLIKRKLIAARNKFLYHQIHEEAFITYQKIKINTHRNNYLIGFWQNAGYVSNHRDELKKEFTPINIRDEVTTKAGELSNSPICAIHVRRGDYLSFFGGSLDESYYFNAIQLIKDLVPDVRFLVFSDDISYCKQLFKNVPGIDYIDPIFNAHEELYLMSKCDSLIIANSTFSWWGAFLSDTDRVVCPVTKTWVKEYYLEPWIKIDTQMIAADSRGLRHCEN